MTAVVARAVMALAICSLGEHRREWALAMQAEYDMAVEDGRPLPFAIGCLFGGWRDLPADPRGRFALTSHALATLLIVPVAALLIAAAIGLPDPVPGLLAGGTGDNPLVTDANRSAMPSLTGLLLLLGFGQLRMAWAMLERDWARVAAMARMSAAATSTSIIFGLVLFLDESRALAQGAALAIELAAVAGLARWHRRLSPQLSPF